MVVCLTLAFSSTLLGQNPGLPADLVPWFQPPEQHAKPAARHRSPLLFEDGRPVRTPEDWARRKAEIRAHWHGLMGQWPPILERPKVERLDTQTIDGISVRRIRLETAPSCRAIPVPDTSRRQGLSGWERGHQAHKSLDRCPGERLQWKDGTCIPWHE